MDATTPPQRTRIAKNVLAAVLDTVIDGVVSIDADGTMLSVNAAAQRIFGYSEAQLIGRNVSMLMPEPYRSAHGSYIQSFRSSGIAKIIGIPGRELVAQRADGSTFPMELGVTETAVEGKQIFVGVIRDITERRAARRLKTELQGVTDVVLDGLVTIDDRGDVQSWNPAAARIFGYEAREIVGKNVRTLMPEPHRSAHDSYMQRYAEGGEARVIGRTREVEGVRKDGTRFSLELAVSELMTDGKRRYVGLVRDVSERKLREAERERLIAALKLSNQELDDFAYIASHDLKEPLRGLANNANFLEEDFREQLGPDGTRRLSRMRYLCQRMEALINDLLYFSRLGRQDLAVRDTDLNRVIVEIAEMMESTLQQDNARIVVPSPLPTWKCDHVRVQELFRNLITNAVKYNHSAEKLVEVGFREQHAGRTAVFYVKDNGDGIEPRFHTEVFRLFKRLCAESDATKGTGAGLTFVKKIVERHKGHIWVESELGQGATFCFTLG